MWCFRDQCTKCRRRTTMMMMMMLLFTISFYRTLFHRRFYFNTANIVVILSCFFFSSLFFISIQYVRFISVCLKKKNSRFKLIRYFALNNINIYFVGFFSLFLTLYRFHDVSEHISEHYSISSMLQ